MSKKRTNLTTAPVDLTALETQNKALKLTLANAIMERQVKALAGRYDVLEPNKARRQPIVETKSEDQTLDGRKRLLSNNLGRDLERNFSPTRAMIHQFRINVVGSEGKIQINTDGGKEAADWFNGVWAKDCDYRDDIHLSTLLQNVVAADQREGDVLLVFDDEVTPDDTGKIIVFESDQIANLNDTEFKKLPGYDTGWTQENGIVRDKVGRILGYIVSGKRGIALIDKIEDATFYPRGVARLVKDPWRFNQGRGIAKVITSAANVQDLYEILAKELQSAKVAAGNYAWVQRENAVVDMDGPSGLAEYLPENSGKDAATVALESANSSDPEARNYERLEAMAGGMIDYVDANDKINIPDINRPNVHLKDFTEFVMGMAGSSMGLARAYALLRADSSYTSFRGDMVLTWATFYFKQKWLERVCGDWIAQKAIAWGERKGFVRGLASDWRNKISWSWPKMPNVDELKEENAIAQGLKNGTISFSDLLGPNWREKLNAYAEQVKHVREIELPLGILETIGGTAQQTGQPANNEE